jgi:hypothetical protein
VEINQANPFIVGGEALPALSDTEREALVKLGKAGGVLPARAIDLTTTRRLRDAALVTQLGPVAVRLTPKGLLVLADMADA